MQSHSAHFEGEIRYYFSLPISPYTSIPEFLKTSGFLANFENICPFVFSIKRLFTLPAVSFFLGERGRGSAEPRTRLDFLLLLQIMAVCFFRTVVMEECCSVGSRERYNLKWFLLSFLLLFLNMIEGDG